MKYSAILLVFGFAVLCARAVDALDTPIKVLAGEDSLGALNRVAGTLPEDDNFFFSQAIVAIRAEFIGNKAYESIQLNQREAMLTAHIEGITPRRFIVFGMILRASQFNERDDWEDSLSGDARVARREHMKKDGMEACRLTLMALKRYKIEANQALVPTVMSVTPAANAPVAPATTAAHL